ncbi:hypothetical protein [Dietzia lutea]|uniref:Uncharacterized protein n=1 Tax=Dietzia lutea TaxID=546160 RepID=A0A2S1RAE1_9ACTN|nr:hypothetical protein [Dietzia lutea]AWH93248.1 hypothetical protein A6035_14850 [Dietzia lutea]
MRATVVGLIALPVTAAGLVLAVTVLDSGNGEVPPTAAERTATASSGGTSGTAGETRVAAPEPAGTAIEGIRPHLTVIDGLSALPVPAPIPSILSTLSAQPADLAPLPPRTDGRTESARSRVGAAAGDGAQRGQIRDTVDRSEPLGSAGSGEDDALTDGTDPRAPRPDQDRPGTPSPMDDDPRGEVPTGDGDEDVDPAEGTPAPDGDGPPPLSDRPPQSGRPPLTSPGPPGGGTPPADPPPYDVDDLPTPDAGTPDRPEHPSDGDAPVVIGPVLGAPIVVPTPDVPVGDTPDVPPGGTPGAAAPADDGSAPR